MTTAAAAQQLADDIRALYQRAFTPGQSGMLVEDYFEKLTRAFERYAAALSERSKE